MKKIVALVLAMVLGISMIGCSSNNSVATVNGEGIPLEYYKIYTNWTRLGYEASYGFTSSTWETKQEELSEAMSLPENASDPAKLMELSNKQAEITSSLEELYEEWETLC